MFVGAGEVYICERRHSWRPEVSYLHGSELQIVVSHQIWVLEIELGSFERGVN